MKFCPVVHIMTNPLKGSIRPVPHINEINLEIIVKIYDYLTWPFVMKPDEIIGLNGAQVDCGFLA